MLFKRTSVAVVVLLLTGVLGLVGCSADSGFDSDLVTVNGSEPQNPLIPSNTNENGGGRIVDRLFAGLSYYDAHGGVHDEVAQSISSPDSKNFTIKLKPGWTFTDGSPVTARSFVDAWNYGALSTNAQLQSYAYTPIVGYDDVSASPPRAQTMSGLQVVDDLTFTVALVAPTIDFELRLGYAPFYPLPDVAYKDMKAFGEHPIGNGPYEFAPGDAWQHNVKLDVVANPGYRGGRPAKNKGLSFVFYQSFDTAYSDLLADNLDVLDTIPDSALAIYKEDLGEDAITAPTAQDLWVGMPANLPHFTGEEGRLRKRAISMAINRKQIGDKIMQGTRLPALDFTARSLPGFDGHLPGSDVLKYDPAEAKKVWAQANAIAPWSGKFQLAYNSDGGHQAWVDAVCNSIKNTLDIDASGAPYPTFKQLRNEISERTVGKAFRAGWQGDYPSMLEFLEPQFLSGSATNDTDYHSPEFDRLLTEAEAATSKEESYRLVAQAQTVLLHDLPAIPLFDYVNAAGHSTSVGHVEIAWNGLADYENITK